ncbi:ATP phosphoribosyltransferase [compost metagenome]
MEILFLRDDDIPQYVEQGVADIGILGLNEVLEQKKQIETIQKLGFAQCRLSLAIPKEESYNGIQYFEGKKIATSYPEILSNYFKEKSINAQIEKIGGSVEIAPGIGLSDAIFDIISTGSTLMTNGLKEVETVVESEAVLVSNNDLSDDKKDILKKLLFRINAVKEASESKYILLNAPNENLEKIINILPGMKSPTILPLAESGWSSIHSVIKEDQFWEVIEKLKNEGAQGILVLEIEKMIL